ncbi:Crp/Fnr family transcriptional regulator [Bacillus sp. FJAT-27251]|uniref:Crp/Fnr family transcriptional regulator n=1 Tax=Bacillus sp. FJAT-27251 TaxID=1684142 RepID=UPI0006A75DD9|nr:Crp/Fnr family transcriptional regulator [Bacillus sp. FJAT-27251]
MEVQHTHQHCGRTQRGCVSQVPIFNHLEDGQMNEVMGMVQSVAYKRGEMVYRAGDPSDSLYIVHTGKIRIYRLSESGKEQLLRILAPGNFTGELALFKDGVHEAFGEAMEETQVCIIRREDLQKLLLKYPSVSLKILTEFSIRLEQSEKQTTRFATEKVEARLASFLAECMDHDRSKEITLPMSKKDLASYLGTTPETISRKLADLEEAGLIQQKSNKKIVILDQDGLLLV